MKLVEAESTGPVEGDDALVTAPRPPHRRVSVSLLFTVTVLVATVVTIYVTFPARNNVLMTAALDHHRDHEPIYDLIDPTPGELHGWATAVIGKDPPLPRNPTTVLGAQELVVLERRVALVRITVGNDPITYLVQQTPVISPDRSDEFDGDLRVIAWRHGPFTCVAVGPAATAPTWLPLIR